MREKKIAYNTNYIYTLYLFSQVMSNESQIKIKCQSVEHTVFSV